MLAFFCNTSSVNPPPLDQHATGNLVFISFSPGLNRVIREGPLLLTVSTVLDFRQEDKPLKRWTDSFLLSPTRLKPGENEI